MRVYLVNVCTNILSYLLSDAHHQCNSVLRYKSWPLTQPVIYARAPVWGCIVHRMNSRVSVEVCVHVALIANVVSDSVVAFVCRMCLPSAMMLCAVHCERLFVCFFE